MGKESIGVSHDELPKWNPLLRQSRSLPTGLNIGVRYRDLHWGSGNDTLLRHGCPIVGQSLGPLTYSRNFNSARPTAGRAIVLCRHTQEFVEDRGTSYDSNHMYGWKL